MKRRPSVRLLAVSAILTCMAFAVTGCGKDPEGIDPDYVAQLESECVELRSQNQELQNRLGELEQSVVLKSYTLKAVAGTSDDEALVEMTAVPMRYEQGQKARFRISLGGSETVTAEGTWDGSAYTASVPLPAEDGYTYECIVTQADGTQWPIVLSSPQSPLYESCVYLASSLNAYCNLFVEDWAQEGDQLTLVAGYARVQLPRISSTPLACVSSDLVLRLGDAELQRVPLELSEGEARGSQELELQNISFAMPHIDAAQQLDLWLEVKLSDGRSLTYNGCSWFYDDENLVLAVG